MLQLVVTVLKLGELYKMLDENCFKVLYSIEYYTGKYEYVPVRLICKKTKIPPKKLDAILGFLNSLKIIKRRLGYEVGYSLTYKALDLIAIKSLVERGVLEAIGEKIGVGKESDIYEALGPGGVRLALKLHRLGRTSFKQTLRLRPYVLEKESTLWIEEAKLSAQREYKALHELSMYTKYVPKPIAYSRHAVVTDFIEGIELYKIRSLSDPNSVLEKVIEVVKIAYKKVGIVHGDLSEYNIIVSFPEENPKVIDWPQYLYSEHPSALEILKRDVMYVVRYFNKRFGLNVNWEEIYSDIIEGKE